ncbi:hypothetical protein JMUB7555_27260 [Staphylococcus aureus]
MCIRDRADTLDITPKLMLQGSVDLLNEVATSKITGEEEIYSHTDLYDFKAVSYTHLTLPTKA